MDYHVEESNLAITGMYLWFLIMRSAYSIEGDLGKGSLESHAGVDRQECTSWDVM